MSAGPNILAIRGLQAKRGGVTVLDVPALDVRESEVLSLVGPNGAGKSSLLLVLARLLPWRRGTLHFHNAPVTAGSGILAYRRKIAMVFQEPLLFDATVFKNVASGLKLRGKKGAEIRKTVADCLEQFGIGHLSDRHARKLSGGEAQRTSLARAFAIRPELIFLDEPLSSLDPPTRDLLIDDLRRILLDTGTTAVLATHDRLEALRLSDRIAVMREGRIIQIDNPQTVMNHPADEFVASFVGMETILSGEIVRAGRGIVTARIEGREIEMIGQGNPGERIVCCIRPEQVTLSAVPAAEGISARNSFAGTIIRTAPLGLFYKVSLDCGFPLIAYVTAPSMENLGLEAGKSVFASVKATAIHLIRNTI